MARYIELKDGCFRLLLFPMTPSLRRVAHVLPLFQISAALPPVRPRWHPLLFNNTSFLRVFFWSQKEEARDLSFLSLLSPSRAFPLPVFFAYSSSSGGTLLFPFVAHCFSRSSFDLLYFPFWSVGPAKGTIIGRASLRQRESSFSPVFPQASFIRLKYQGSALLPPSRSSREP